MSGQLSEIAMNGVRVTTLHLQLDREMFDAKIIRDPAADRMQQGIRQ